jgi:hypothetical protein
MNADQAKFLLSKLPDRMRSELISKIVNREFAAAMSKASPVARSSAHAFAQAKMQDGVLARVKCESLAEAVESYMRVSAHADAEGVLDMEKMYQRFRELEPIVELTNGSAVEVSWRMGSGAIVAAVIAMHDKRAEPVT